ncbi:hypothetical protein AB1Y20_002140 [Prymnesium parvum]|uniref:Uncharacterized protein n=1 Tax=Prymnesium parvum TaxID=97485 RepID=A0AB34J834_PRYPA
MEGLCGEPLASLAATLARGDRAALADELRQLGVTTVGARARLEGELIRAASAAEARRAFRESTNREGSELTLREGSELTHRDGSELTLHEGNELTLREGSELTHRDGSELTLRDGSELTLREGDVTSAARCGGAATAGAPLLSPPAGWPSCYERARSGLKPFVAERLRGARVRLCARLSSQNAAPLAAVPLSATDARENARRVYAATGWQVLRGYAVFQLAARAEEREAAGEGSAVFVGRAWWWNVKPNGAWVDATPRGYDYPLVLVESAHDVASPAASVAEWEDQSKPAEGALHAAALSAEQQLFSLAVPMVVQVGEGLCNRLRALLSYREVALSQGRPLLVVWAVDAFCNGRFQDVFEPLPGKHVVYGSSSRLHGTK